MAELKFKHGSYLDLMNADGTPNTSKTKLSEGTIYVTTDERAMFVDLKKPNENTASRIRLEGAVQYYDSVTDFVNSTKPPYNKNTLYFFRTMKKADDSVDTINAFMAWDGSEWRQVNVSMADFVALAERVSNAETAITTHTNRLDVLYKEDENGEESGKIVEIEEFINGLDNRLTDLDKNNGRMDSAEDRLDALDGTNGKITTIESDLRALDNETNGRVTVLEGTASNLSGRVNTLETNMENLIKEDGRLEQIETNISENVDNISSNAEAIEALQQLVGTGDGTESDLSGRLKTAEEDIGELQNTVANTITPTLTTYGNRLDDLYEEAENGTKTGKIVDIENRLDAIHGIDGTGGEIKGIKDRLDALDDGTDGEIKGIKDRLDVIHGADGAGGKIKELENAVTTINNTTIPGINSVIEGQATAISGLQGRMTTAEGNITNLQGRMTTAEGNITNLQGRMTTAEGEIDDLQEAVNTINTTMAVKTEVEQDIADLKTELQAEIDSDINAANAMTFKGVIATKDDLPIDDVRIGDTYVLSETDSYSASDTTIEYSAGDFFIAGKKNDDVEEDATGFLPSDGIKWSHVKSGYDAAFDPTLQSTITPGVYNAANSNLGKAVVSLGSFAGKNCGQINISTQSENIKISQVNSTANSKNNTIGISLEWGTF